jgi:hypothetical protein
VVTENIEKLKYPVGRYSRPEVIGEKQIQEYISMLEIFPTAIEKEVTNLQESSLEWVYRPSGWCIRQVIHHCADSHMNAFLRIKLALTESTPTIKPYKEALWAELPDSLEGTIDFSIQLLHGLHNRMVYLLRNLKEGQLDKQYHHPEQNRDITVRETLALYAWHCRHHLEHVKQAINHKGNF